MTGPYDQEKSTDYPQNPQTYPQKSHGCDSESFCWQRWLSTESTGAMSTTKDPTNQSLIIRVPVICGRGLIIVPLLLLTRVLVRPAQPINSYAIGAGVIESMPTTRSIHED